MNVLITKLTTTNLGNEVLSRGIIALAEGKDFQVVGRPEDLHRYTLENLRAANSASQCFDSWVEGLLAVYRVARLLRANAAPPSIKIVRESAVRPSTTRKRLSRIKAGLIANLPAGPKYLRRAAVLGRSRAVIYSGAGEVGDYDAFLRQLVELEALVRLGKKVYATNQSVVVETEPLLSITASVYRKLQGIVVRGQLSKDKLVALGVAGSAIRVAPDTAWMSPRQPANVTRASGRLLVGLTVNGQLSNRDEWAGLIADIRKLGASIVFITSDVGYDIALGREICGDGTVTLAPPCYEASDYARVLAGFDLVVTERLHTAVLALIQGVPVVAIERGGHKTGEVFDVFGRDLVPVLQKTTGWQSRVLAAVNDVRANAALSEQISTRSREMALDARRNMPSDWL